MIELVSAARFIACDKIGRILARLNRSGDAWIISPTQHTSFPALESKRYRNYQEAIADLQAIPRIALIRAIDAEVNVWKRSEGL